MFSNSCAGFAEGGVGRIKIELGLRMNLMYLSNGMYLSDTKS
jgi:hypothetical protein